MSAGPLGGVELEHESNDFPKVFRVKLRNRVELALDDRIGKSFHILSLERDLKSCHFVDDNSQRPNIRLRVIRFLVPDLWTGIVRRTSLGVEKSFFGDFRYIEVSKFGLALFVEKNVG